MKNTNTSNFESISIPDERSFSTDVEINEIETESQNKPFSTSGSFFPVTNSLGFLQAKITRFSNIEIHNDLDFDLPIGFIQQTASSQTGISSFLETRFIDSQDIYAIAVAAIKNLEEYRKSIKKLEIEEDAE